MAGFGFGFVHASASHGGTRGSGEGSINSLYQGMPLMGQSEEVRNFHEKLVEENFYLITEVWDLIKLGDHLSEWEDVDPCRVGITGESLRGIVYDEFMIASLY
uniref:Uncharacterized protein n=1 Tax=Oryza sativa subsp. japonica TaxID=39947 RepID=Q6ZIA6_ORYSJ|nr:hypothetical protein [Oryza sativa Japonica Group]BAD09114.1 hypothetical protein [Oryza sativa Japonica Group]